MARRSLDRKVDLAFLAAFYGGLLTENQRRILSLYCEEDFSLGEIAEETGISRQAAHESVTRAAARLDIRSDSCPLLRYGTLLYNRVRSSRGIQILLRLLIMPGR